MRKEKMQFIVIAEPTSGSLNILHDSRSVHW